MSRVIGAELLRAMQREQGDVVYLIELQFSGGTIRVCTGAHDLSWNSQTWQAVGGAIRLGAAQESTDADAQGVELELSGVDQAILAILLAQQHRGRLGIIYEAHLAMADNRVDFSEDLSQWTAGGTTATAGQADPLGGTRAYLIGDDSAVATEERTRTVSFLSNGPKTLGLWVKLGASPASAGSQIRIRDTTAGVDRVRIDVSNTLAITSGIGSQLLEVDNRWPGGWVLVRARDTGIVAANAHHVGILPAVGGVASTGDVGVFGFHSGDGPNLEGYEYRNGTAIRGGAVVGALEIFRGYMNDSWQVDESRTIEGGAVRIVTRLISRLARLRSSNGARCNVSAHNAMLARAGVATGDTFFRQVTAIMNKRIYWGQDAPPGGS